YREMVLYENLMFSPVNMVGNIDPWYIPVNVNILYNKRIQIFSRYPYTSSHRTILRHLYRGYIVNLPGLLPIIIIQIPCFIIVRTFLIAYDHISCLYLF